MCSHQQHKPIKFQLRHILERLGVLQIIIKLKRLFVQGFHEIAQQSWKDIWKTDGQKNRQVVRQRGTYPALNCLRTLLLVLVNSLSNTEFFVDLAGFGLAADRQNTSLVD